MARADVADKQHHYSGRSFSKAGFWTPQSKCQQKQFTCRNVTGYKFEKQNGQIMAAYDQESLHPLTKDGGGESWESWTFIPATTQDPALPELDQPCVIALAHRRMRGLGGLHLQGACLDDPMFTVMRTALQRSCSASWTSWGGMWVRTAKKCYLGSWVPFLSFFSTAKKEKRKKEKSLFRLIKHAN